MILSAGALQSPQLLQLSGIGPAALLRRHGIAVAVDAPEVGRNLQDHYQARVIVKLKEKRSLNDDVRNPLRLAQMGAAWLFSQRGPLTVGAGQVGGLVATEHAEGGRADVLFNVMPLSVDKPGDPLHRFSGFSASAAQCRPESKGTVEIAGPDPLALPRIRAGYLTDPRDAKVLVAGLRLLREIYAQPAFRGLVTGEEYLPGNGIATPTALEAFARAKGGTVFHPAGSCRMGGDAGAVVDERLQGARHRGAARDRRLGHAAAGLDQHQCGGDRDRRKGRGDAHRGPGRRAGARARASGSDGVILDKAQVPLYVQLADLFRQRIVKGVWREGEMLPSLEKLVAEFGVARVTVRQAIERLTRDGLVSPQRGRGTFVTGAPQADRWLKVETTLENLAEVYRDTQPTILAIDESTRMPRLNESDGVAAERYVYMRRVHAHEGRPYCVLDIYLDAAIFARRPARFRRETVIPLLLAMPSVQIVTARQMLTISTADLEVARHLGVSVNAPVAEVRRVFTGPERRVIYLGEITYRGDYVQLEMDLKG